MSPQGSCGSPEGGPERREVTVCLYKRLGIWENPGIMGPSHDNYWTLFRAEHCAGDRSEFEACVCSGVFRGQATGALRPVVFLEPRPCALSFSKSVCLSPFASYTHSYSNTHTHAHSHTPMLTLHSHNHLHSHAHIHSLTHVNMHTHILTETPCPLRKGRREPVKRWPWARVGFLSALGQWVSVSLQAAR